MKKIVTALIIGSLSVQLFAVDLSHETGQDQSVKNDMSMSVKKSSDNKNSKRKFKSKIDSAAYSADVIYDPTSSYLTVAGECVTTQKVPADFGLTAEIDDGIIDLNRKAYLDNGASQSMTVSQLGGDEEGIKKHIKCMIANSAIMAQSNLDLIKKLSGKSFSASQIDKMAIDEFQTVKKLTDRNIAVQFERSINSINKNHCRFATGMTQTVQCGTVVYSFADNSVKNAGIVLTGSDRIFGISTSFRVSMNDTTNDGNENANEISNGSSRDQGLTKSKSDTLNRSSKETTNVSPYLPK